MSPFQFVRRKESRKPSHRPPAEDKPRTLYDADVARAFAGPIVAELRSRFPLGKVAVAGSLRRGHASVHDVDILLGLPDPSFMDGARWRSVFPSALVSPQKVTLISPHGLHADVRVVPLASWGAALQYYTGSREHNVWVRTLANRQGLSLSEYGFRPFDPSTKGWGPLEPVANESDVYKRLGLHWLPPRYRERTHRAVDP